MTAGDDFEAALERAHLRSTLFNRVLCAIGGWSDADLEDLAKALRHQHRRGVYESVTGKPQEGSKLAFQHPGGGAEEALPPLAYVCHPVAPRDDEAVCMACGAIVEDWTHRECPRCHGGEMQTGDLVALANAKRARRWWRWLAQSDRYAWMVPWVVNVEEWIDADPAHRRRGLRDDVAIVSRCDVAVLVGGRVTQGMNAEANGCLSAGGAVYDLTYLGAEPPRGAVPGLVEWRIWRPS